jgi:hypothetical protein
VARPCLVRNPATRSHRHSRQQKEISNFPMQILDET